jgi:hypothetical protein
VWSSQKLENFLKLNLEFFLEKIIVDSEYLVRYSSKYIFCSRRFKALDALSTKKLQTMFEGFFIKEVHENSEILRKSSLSSLFRI